MYEAVLHSRKSCSEPAPSTAEQPATEHPRANTESDGGWIANAVASFAHRRRIGAQFRLFSDGDPASSYYLVETGKFLVHRRLARSRQIGPFAAVRVLSSGDLFNFNCGDRRAADCDALADSIVLSIDRRQFRRLAAVNPELKRAQCAMHADELVWIQQKVGTNHDIGESPQP